jgi:hypothetical protein
MCLVFFFYFIDCIYTKFNFFLLLVFGEGFSYRPLSQHLFSSTFASVTASKGKGEERPTRGFSCWNRERAKLLVCSVRPFPKGNKGRATSKGLVGVGTKASRREAYEELVGTKQRGFAGPTPQLRLSVGEAALWSLEQQPKAKGKEESRPPAD